MPAPTKAMIKPIVDGLFASKQFTGDNINDLSDVIAEAIAQSLTMFLAQGKVLPGIPAVVAPPPAAPVGSTVGPGSLMPPPAGGPGKGTIKPIVDGLFASKQFTGENISDLADVMADAIAQGIMLFTSMVKVAPGIPIAGGVTAAPGMFM
ncbi:MAG: hypothetical protein V1749_07195 [Candidatus Desantisbacteria bacterium]